MDAVVIIIFTLVLVLRPNTALHTNMDGNMQEFEDKNRNRVTRVNENLYKDEDAFMVIAKALI